MGTLIDDSLGSPIQGVSQQEDTLRGEGMANEQINLDPKPTKGLVNRAPSKYKTRKAKYQSYLKFIDTQGEKFLCVSGTSQTVEIYDPDDNTFQAVTLQPDFNSGVDAYNYLNSSVSNPDSLKLRATVFDDDLYITNPNVTVTGGTPASFRDRRTDTVVVNCLGGQYSHTYKITLNLRRKSNNELLNASVSYTTPDGSSSSHAADITSSNIIAELNLAIQNAGWLPSNQGIVDNPTIFNDYMLLEAGSNFDILGASCSDDEGGVALKCTNQTVKSIEDLPEYAVNGMLVTIAGQTGDEDDSYYEFRTTEFSTDTTSATFGQTGVFVESVKEGDEFEFANETMPVVIRNVSGTSPVLELESWQGREIGDADSNETPSVLNKIIKDLDNLQGRLVILTPDTFLMSRTDRPDELWRRTITGGINDDDAIDGKNDNSTGEHTFLVKNARDLSIFTRQGQYVILGNQRITPTNINMTLSTREVSVPDVPPVGVSGNIYFPTDDGEYVGLAEYFKDENNYFTLPVSDHIPTYIRGKATHISGSGAQQMISLSTDLNAKLLYCYKFLFSGQKRVQSAWFKLEFNDDIVFFEYVRNSLILITQDGTDHHVFERIDFDVEKDPTHPFIIHLDRQYEYTVDSSKEITLLDVHDPADLVLISLDRNSGLPVEYTDNQDGTLTLPEGEEGDKVLVGYTVQWSYSPTAPRVFDRDRQVIRTGDLSVYDLLVNVVNSGRFSWKIETDYGTTTEGEFSNRRWDDPNNQISRVPLVTGQRRVPWRGLARQRNCTLYGNSHTPINIPYIEFRADFRKTGSRI